MFGWVCVCTNQELLYRVKSKLILTAQNERIHFFPTKICRSVYLFIFVWLVWKQAAHRWLSPFWLFDSNSIKSMRRRSNLNFWHRKNCVMRIANCEFKRKQDAGNAGARVRWFGGCWKLRINWNWIKNQTIALPFLLLPGWTPTPSTGTRTLFSLTEALVFKLAMTTTNINWFGERRKNWILKIIINSFNDKWFLRNYICSAKKRKTRRTGVAFGIW